MRTIVTAAVAVLAGTCSHAGRPCPPNRPVAQRPPTLAPTDPATAAAVAETGTRYEVCPERHGYLLLRNGRRVPTEPELHKLQAALQGAGPGVEMSGLGDAGCGVPADRQLGVQVWVRDDLVPPAVLAQRLAAVAGELGGEASVRVQVTIRSTPGPRCAAGDPGCGPIPYKAACLERTDYDAKGERKVVRSFGGRGDCRHDGECFVAGCGNDCVPALGTNLVGTCELVSRWDNVYCGCVRTECAWFTTE